jgi:hypothetical protein
MLCLTDNVKEMQVKLSKRMNNSKRNSEAFNVKVGNMPGKLGANMAIYIIVKWNNALIRQIR